MRTKVYHLLICCLVWGMNPTAWAQYNWANMGPDNLGSITRALVFDANGRLIAGSQSGGLWVSEDEGRSWQRMTSYDEAGGNPNISTIAVSGNDIYVGTGALAHQLPYVVTNLNVSERNYDFRNQPEGFKGYLPALPGNGIWISRDNGQSWSHNNATIKPPFGQGTESYQGPFVGIQKIHIKGNRIFVGAYSGLFYSDDGLNTLIPAQGSNTFKESIVFDIENGDGNVILAGTHNLIQPDSLYISTNNGASFSAASDPIFYKNGIFSFGRTEITTHPSDAKIIYVGATSASGEINSVYRSDDNGTNWRLYAPKGSPGFTPLGTTGRDAFILSTFPDNPNELILAGNNWYTFQESRGWTQTAQHNLPFIDSYLPRRMYSLLFDPNDPNKFYVGTSRQIMKSEDRGESFRQRSKGYEAQETFSVAATGLVSQEAILGGSALNGTIYNQNFTNEIPVVRQGYGTILGNNFGGVAASYVYLGAILAKGSDDGIERSLNFGESFERFYGTPISPQVAGLTGTLADTFIDRTSATTGGGRLVNTGTTAQAPYLLDERIPANLIGNPNSTRADIEENSEVNVFYCSKNYIWLVTGAFGDGLQVKWNRVSNALVDGVTEQYTAIAIAPDAEHTLYVGTSKGNLWRISGAHDLSTFDATADVFKLNTPSSNLAPLTGRWISSVTVDPQDPERVAITYAAYGGDVNAPQGFVWMSTNAKSADPKFGILTGFSQKELSYASKFVKDPQSGNSVLLIGTETGLYSVKNFAGIAPVFTGQWTDELGGQMGAIPVYDIYVRPYTQRITNEDDQDFTLEEDNTVFVATHGRGVWSTASLRANRQIGPGPISQLPDEILTILYPNPAQQGAIQLYVNLPENARTRVRVLNLKGQVVHVLDEPLSKGDHSLRFETAELAAGVYLFQIQIEGETKQLHRSLKAFIRP